jgi:hypothetical protein
MEIKRKTEIFVSTNRRFIVRQSPSVEPVFCPACSQAMLSSEQAAVVFETNCRTVFRLVESGSIHFTETETGSVMVCLPSLATVLRDEPNQLIEGEKSPEP